MADDNDSLDDLPLLKKPTLIERVRGFHQGLTGLVDPEQRGRRYGAFVYRFILLVLDGISRTELTRRAAALTYTTILSIFPLLAVVSSSASFFYTPEKEAEFMGWIENQLLPSLEGDANPETMTAREKQMFEQQQAMSNNVRTLFANVSNKFRESAAGVGVFGFIGLLVTCGLLYYSIESVVNLTWQTGHRGRWTQTLTNFITVLVLAPIIIGLSITSSTVALMLLEPEEKPMESVPAMTALTETAPVDTGTDAAPAAAVKKPSRTLQRIRSITTNFGFIVPYISMILNAIILALAYSFLPKTKVYFRYALIGGLLASVLWQGARVLFVYYVFMSSVNRTLADALGVSVIFLIWIYITWTILLLGNVIVYTSQRFETLWAEKKTGEQMLLDGRLMLAAMVLLARRFERKGGGYTDDELQLRLGLRDDQLRQLIARLVGGGMIVPIEGGGYQVAHPLDRIRVGEILELGCDLRTLPAARRGKSPLRGVFEWLQDRTIILAGEATLLDLLKLPNEAEKIIPVSGEPQPTGKG